MKFIGETSRQHHDHDLDLDHMSFQVRVWRLFGCIPLLVSREAVPDEVPGTWKWGRWKLASYFDVWKTNRMHIDWEKDA